MNLANKSKKIIIMLLFLIPLIFTLVYSGIGFSRPITEGDDDNQITIMTYNIHFGVGMDDKLDLERLAQNILTENPDIIGLQEVENGRFTSQGVDMSLWLATRLNMYYRYYPAVSESAFGVALLSKYPILESNTYDLTSIQLERVLLHCKVQINLSFNLNVFVTHIGLDNENQTKQIEEILQITNPITDAKVLMGDFNMWENDSNIEWIKQTFNDTWRDYNPLSNEGSFPSYPVARTYNRIDYIFATNITSILDSHIVSDMLPSIHEPWEFGSDHLPVVSTLIY
jgi:endonuclease/exonuclease/phosphatase family metal-dependent hydrolase